MNSKIEKALRNNRWYHGTTLFNWIKMCNIGVKYDYNIGHELDFGYGFYLTPEQKQAESYITRLMEYRVEDELGVPIKNAEFKKIPVVIEFEFSPIEYYGNRNFKLFPAYDDEFANFVFHNRVNNVDGDSHHNFDIIYGVMSDSIPTVIIQKFKNNQMSKNEVIQELKKSTSVKQLSLHKQDLCDIIKPTKAINLLTREELNINDYINR